MSKTEKIMVVAVLPDGAEHYGELESRHNGGFPLKQFAEEAVRANGLTTDRKDPQDVSVRIYALVTRAGKLERDGRGHVTVMPPLKSLTVTEYEAICAEQYNRVPEDFRSYVADELGSHSCSGMDESADVLADIVDRLLPAIKAFMQRIKDDSKYLKRIILA